jgi:cytochrome c biogenesis protein CcdA
MGGNQLRGWPGYRTRPNRSGLDPLDTRAEAAHMEGTFIRSIFTLRARTRNPFYLVLMFIFGVIPFFVLTAFLISAVGQPNQYPWIALIYLISGLLITGALALNFLLSMLELLGVVSSQKNKTPDRSHVQNYKKKLPKRRKDYR